MLRATKIRIYPTAEQAEFLNHQFDAVRFAWNKALAIKTHYYKVRNQNLSPKKHLKPLLATALGASHVAGSDNIFDDIGFVLSCTIKVGLCI